MAYQVLTYRYTGVPSKKLIEKQKEKNSKGNSYSDFVEMQNYYNAHFERFPTDELRNNSDCRYDSNTPSDTSVSNFDGGGGNSGGGGASGDF